MDEYIIDCCSLLNLYTGWGGLTELRSLRRTWHVCEGVLHEAEYTREYGSDGNPVVVPLDMATLIRSGIVSSTYPESEREINDYVDFASEVDDGEAQALAIAKHRGYRLLTDDRKAIKIASRADVAVPTVSTTEILRAWAQIDPANQACLPKVVRRITELARFDPPRDSFDYAWWQKHLRA